MITQRATAAWRRLWASVAFRLTFNYGLLAVCTTIFLLIFAYGKIVDVFQTQFSRQVILTTQRLAVHSQEYGRQSLRSEIRQLLSDQTDIDTEMYLLIDEQGRKLAGNLDLFPASDYVRDPPAPIQLNVLRAGTPVTALLGIHPLADGSLLVVGRDTHDLKEIKKLIGNAIIAATLVGLLLVLIGTFIFRRELRRRVEAIRDTAFHVGTGELTRRVPVAPDEDEFAQLRQDINHMLDRIETLMKGVRNVSDSIAHNIRTPLARVLAKLDQARHEMRDAAALSVAIDSASDEIMDLISVAEKLLLIAEAESGVRRQSFRPVQLERLARDVIELYEPLADESGTRLAMSRPSQADGDAGTWVLADADLLAGSLANLVDNALKYAGDGARITITTASRGDKAVLTVSDNGPGVAASDLALLGTRFYRVSPDIPGSGLGLASVQAIAFLHEGALHFHDAGPGLRVEIELPLHQAP
ncbi:sensor histidine kinase [Pollutimonas sp. M17]|uniref:HAMP domain-containing sensor histidine kinase n=1 Tax=Pollutimonas sp. M17 TaxID=2962065 RepID=UPI0021F4F3E5|nr:HAMP domain-containing sensor histidine kinase [Pollutimonas sp. M17]UYO95433.1 HAMP domain-containing histidine kinase [Pollutimonas sp. M17]